MITSKDVIRKRIEPFTFTSNPARIIFGAGRLSDLSSEIERLGCRKALILSTPFQQKDARALAWKLGDVSAGVFPDATMHTPVDVTERALAAYKVLQADCVVSYGGGSTIGLGKAIALRNDTHQIAIPTTYAGSEVTPILGQTENGRKTTLRSDAVLPDVVIYDPELTSTLPADMSVTSGLNAIAHSIEGLYARDRNPISSLMALDGIRALARGLPDIVASPGDMTARTEALFGAWLCGAVLGTVGMSLHHKLCHTLGGSFNTPHAETHAILIPHTTAFNLPAARRELEPLSTVFGEDIGRGLWDFAASIGAPLALRDLGLTETDLDAAAEIATQNPYWNPREFTRDDIRALLQNAWAGTPPPPPQQN